VILWDLSDPAHPQRLGQPLVAHTGAVSSVAFGPDGARLVTASDDHTLLLWDFGLLQFLLDRAVELACAYAGGGFDREDWARYVIGSPYRDSCPTA
jgi:WD40 repeat protein